MSPRPARGRDGEITEAVFQAQVIALAQFYQWRIYHPPDNKPTRTRGGVDARQRVARGFPDLILIRGPELIVAELKRHNGRTTREQDEWLDAWRTIGDAIFDAIAELENITQGAAGVTLEGPRPVVDVYVWRPADWPELEQRLARGRVLQPWTP